MFGVTPILSIFHFRYKDKTGVVINGSNIVFLDDVLSGTKKLEIYEVKYLVRYVNKLGKVGNTY